MLLWRVDVITFDWLPESKKLTPKQLNFPVSDITCLNSLGALNGSYFAHAIFYLKDTNTDADSNTGIATDTGYTI